MKATIKGLKLTFDLSDLVDDLGTEDRTTLARLVAADKQLFAGVLQCVSSTGLYGHFFEEADSGDWWFDNTTLLELRQKLMPLMPDIARGAVEEALRQRNAANAERDRMNRWAWQLYHGWPDSSCLRPESPPGWKPVADATEEEVDAIMAGKVSP